MSNKKAKEIRKGYRGAGAIYWTKDMEKSLRRIRARGVFFMSTAAIEAVFIVGFILRGAGVL